ncbi:hypothetical protein FGU71_02085 [Erythrobacter insulae]|uniref:Glycine zipper family protein n=1 Tax=Erythrobacter insulae TaxID=2584124 RepID=A0A547P9Q7_9SPHN|nr:hypothetical protein [Erythrobacter insulae]TRD10774.1 hypothetical protein FGU71_02085 [Erythrobacter insulae]
MKYKWAALVGAPLLALASAAPSAAQTNEMTDKDWREWQPDPAELSMPVLDFEPDDNDVANYKKYYYFNRSETSFEEALSDLRFCDELARGLATQNYYSNAGTSAIYGVGGVIGGAIGGAMAQAIYGSAEKRAKRRVNMRRCMHFKGYARHGLAKDLWQEFNFEEGNSSVEEKERQNMLAVQALVASSDLPATENVGL